MPPPTPPSRLEQAKQLVGAEQFQQAKALLMRLVAASPDDPETCQWLAVTLGHLREHAKALYYAERAAAKVPGDLEARHTLATMLLFNGKIDKAVELLKSVLATNPRHLPSWNDLLMTMDRLNKRSEMIDLCRRATAVIPQIADTWTYLASNLSAAGLVEESDRVLLEGLRHRPDHPLILSMRTHMALYRPGVDAAEQASIARTFGQAMNRHAPVRNPPPRFDPDPDRPLRVGVICADLHRHVSSNFLAPLLEHLDRAQFPLTLYHTGQKLDEVSDRFKAISTWRHLPDAKAQQVFEAARTDAIDIMIDCAGHTRGNSMGAFHHRLAPVQATYLGCPGTTGVPAMDYRLVDSITNPPGSEGDSTEALVRLDPCFVTYQPFFELPALVPPPCTASPDAPVTFCCFNALIKLNPQTFELWARVLEAVPGSKILMKYRGLEEPPIRKGLIGRMTAAGMDPARLEIEDPVSSLELFNQYNRADIGLDPFPYHGTTTTCEALSMGVPVVTLMGRTTASRVGGSLLHAVGLDDLIAQSPDEYVRIAAALAADRQRLASIRRSLRRRTAEGLGGHAAFARRFESALRWMWRDMLQRRAPAPLTAGAA